MPGPLDARPEVSSEGGSGHSGFRVGQNPDTQTGERNAVEPTVAVPVERLCQTIESAAREYDLPVEFFTRLIWQESRFDTHAVSRAGAQGIAQFMPATAVRVGLRNPFDPFEAIMKSAEHLRDLRKQFGSLGLAAAAYNAGPKGYMTGLHKLGGCRRRLKHTFGLLQVDQRLNGAHAISL
jgi:soluble lytic murein transglycosylase-like protein